MGFTTFWERSGEEEAFSLMRSLSKLMGEGGAPCSRFFLGGRGALFVHLAAITPWTGSPPEGGTLVKQRYMLSAMSGRSTYKLTWTEIVGLNRLP